MKESIKHKKKEELVEALKKVPQSTEVCIRAYLEKLEKHLKDFQLEIEWNIYIKNSYCFTIDYVNDLIADFKYLYMTMDGTFDILIFPEIISEFEPKKYPKIKNCFDSHKFIYLRTISMLQQKENIVKIKITHKIPLVESPEESFFKGFVSKYKLKEKNIMHIIEIGHYLHARGNIVLQNGNPLDLIPFIKDLGYFVGEDIKHIHQRIDEYKNKANPHKFLDSLIKINVAN